MKKLFLTALCLIIVFRIVAQESSVSIGTTETKASAVLWLNSVNKNQGLIIPTVTSRNAIVSPGPEAGMIVYDLTDNSIFFFNGTIWIEAGGGDVLPVSADNVTIENAGGIMRVKDGGITPEKISPSATDGQVLTTSGGSVTWAAPAAGSGSVTSVTVSSPLNVINPTTTPTISVPQANGSTSGFLNSADWTTFNNKLGSGSTAGGDLSGTFPNPTVGRIRGINVSSTAPTANQVLRYNGTEWAPSTASTGTVTNVSGTAPISVATQTTTPVISINQANTTTSGYLSNTDWNTFNGKLNGNILTTSGDLLFHNGTITTRLPRGTNGQVLSSTGTGIQWSNPTGFANPMTTAGDIIAGGVGGAPTRVAGGTGFLKSTGAAIPTWSTISGADLAPDISISTTGNIATTGTGTLSSASLAGSGTRMVVADATGTLGAQAIPSNFTTADVLPKGSATGLVASQIFDDGTNVGIGTTSPGATVDISATSPTLRLSSTGAISTEAASSLIFRNSINGNIGSIGDTGSSDHLQISSFVQGILFNTAFGTRMSIDNNGFVGIGTTLPSETVADLKLESFGNTILRPAIIGSAPYLGTSWFSMQHQQLPLNDISYSFAQHKGGYTLINTPSNSGNNFIDLRVDDVTQVRLLENGNVGIGTIAPSAKLEVNGFTKLGSDAPAIKVKKFESITHGSMGGEILIAHGLDVQKIISVQAMVEQDTDEFVPANYSLDPDYNFSWALDPTNIKIRNGATASKIIANPVVVTVIYEE